MNNEFKSYIADFNAGETSIFSRNGVTKWKPIILLSKEHFHLFAYLTIFRSSNGHWVLMIQSPIGPQILKKWTVQITIRKKSNEENCSNGFSFSGEILSHEISDMQAIQKGQYLPLSDHHVKNMISGQSLFEYTIKFQSRDNKD